MSDTHGRFRVGVDVGGTFTDAAVFDDAAGSLRYAKVPSTAADPARAVLDVLMVADEVITGFFRTGNRFASETFGIRPDIMTLAKQLSAAYLPSLLYSPQ